MHFPRVTSFWHLLISISVLTLFFLSKKLLSMEGESSRVKLPLFQDGSSLGHKGSKNGKMTEDNFLTPSSKSEADKFDTEDAKMTVTKEKLQKVRKGWNRMIKKKEKHPSLFALKDHQPGVTDSKPLRYGLNAALSRLNYEFSSAKDAFKANDILKKVPNFVASKANIMDIVGNIPVGRNIPLESARQILIATTWRSGSTFLGDLLNHYKGTFYYFEPLHYYSTIRDKSQVQNETSFLRSLYACDFSTNNVGFLNHVSQHSNKFLFENHNFRLWNSCHNLLPDNVMCFMPDYINRICPLYPIKLIKTVRIRVSSIEELLKDPAMDLKVIHLVRDPRGVYNSRQSGVVKNWCNNDECANPETGCHNLNKDIQAAFSLESRYPRKILLVRYEDLSMFPEETSKRMLKFLDLPYTEGVADFIESHTSREKMKVVKNKKTKKLERLKDIYGTARNSTATAFAWREELAFDTMKQIQEACLVPMDKLGYKIVESEEDLHNEILPIEKTADQIWPL